MARSGITPQCERPRSPLDARHLHTVPVFANVTCLVNEVEQSAIDVCSTFIYSHTRISLSQGACSSKKNISGDVIL